MRTLGTLAGVCVAVLAFSLIGVSRLRHGHSFIALSDQSAAAYSQDVEAGDRVCRPGGGTWGPVGSKTLIVVTSATCPVCTVEAPFEEQVLQRAREAGLKVVYVLPESARNDSFAASLRSRANEVLRTNLTFFGARRTPSLLLVDRTGLVLSMWIGAVPSSRRAALLENLLAGISSHHYNRISRSDLEKEASIRPLQIVALSRPHGGFPSAGLAYHLISDDELGTRVKYELKEDQPIFLDCDTAASPGACQEALLRIADGSRVVYAVNLPRGVARCKSVEQ